MISLFAGYYTDDVLTCLEKLYPSGTILWYIMIHLKTDCRIVIYIYMVPLLLTALQNRTTGITALISMGHLAVMRRSEFGPSC